MAPPYLSAFYLVVPLFAVPVVIRNGIRSIYTPVPLLALLAALAGGFGLVENPRVQDVLQTLLAVALGGSVLHLQGLANAPVPMLATTALLLVCATLLSFSPRLSQVSPMLFLIFIVATLGATAFLFFTRRRPRSSVTLTLAPVPPSPTPSHMSFQYTNSPVEKPPFAFLRSSSSELDLSSRRPSLQQHTPPAPSSRIDLFLILSVQLSYIIATSFCIPTALHSPAATSPPLVSLVTASSDISTYIFHVLDTLFKIIALLLVFGAYYHCSGHLPLLGIGSGQTSTPNGTPTIPRRPSTRILSPSTSPTPTRLHSLIIPISPTTTSTCPIKLEHFKPKHKRAGPSASSSFFSSRPKRTPLVPTSNLDSQPEIVMHAPYELDLEPISPCPSSSTIDVVPNPSSLAPDTKERRSSIDSALPPLNPTSDPVLVRVATPMPVFVRERAWSWAHSMQIPKDRRPGDARDVTFDDEDCTDLKDPFASGPARPPVAPSAYQRWAESVDGSSSKVKRWSEYEAYPQTRMSMWGHLPSYQLRKGRTAPSLRIDTTVCAST